MRIFLVLVLIVLILGIMYYTDVTVSLVKIVGKNTVSFTKSTYSELSEKSGEFKEVKDDLVNKYQEWKEEGE